MVLLDLLKLKNIFSQNMHSFIIELLPLLGIKCISCCNSGVILLQQSDIQKRVNKLKSDKSVGNLGFDSDHCCIVDPNLWQY